MILAICGVRAEVFYNGYNGLSAAEIAAAVSAAKDASANVHSAQHRVHLAKEEVLARQKIASEKQAAAALAVQHTEVAVAVQRQRANAAANALVLAQQRLAHAKAVVAEHQRIASEKEAAAAAAIHHAANIAAYQIKKNENTNAKIAALNSVATNAFNHIATAKDTTLAATSAAIQANVDPWHLSQNVVHLPLWG
ncbi:uncharacterized protein LOC116176299 isoform X2 [Photinus pyralis]|uniref:Uncharacterized protein n=2 Tax=Photinus pyralis TaxID=7054 RepID=A0A1Y1N897_PHOPY|nr:uncharacterized protein LOC116176299 isoform X2 [Photinus pyralis]XP_031350656.1 uncharacterized protein LOC116176299 isoform X2 [Photinus pyralis]XP_031350657.1 uncharacterized protein LOC116176299 isoform X2 [Photinus pyralis]